MARPDPNQLAFAFPEPRFSRAPLGTMSNALQATRSPVNDAGQTVLDVLRACFPPHVSLDALYIDLVDARFETRPHPCSGEPSPHAVADFVLFDGEGATCVVHKDPRPARRGKLVDDWLMVRWENCSYGWGWDDDSACWIRRTPH